MKHKPTIRLEKDSSCISIKTISVFYITKSKGNKNPDTETTQKEKAEKERKKERKRVDLVVEGDTSVGTNALLTSTESSEILCRFGHHMVVKLNHYPSFKLSSYAYVQKAPWSLPHLSHSVVAF